MYFKKTLALVLSLVMVLGLCTIPAFAEEAFDPFAGDYVKGEMPENLITVFKAAMWTTGKNDAQIELAGINWKNADSSIGWEGGYMGGKLYTPTGITSVASHLNSAGFGFQQSNINKDTSTYLAGEHYVFMFAVRNVNTEVPASVRVGAFNGTYSGVVSKDFLPVQEYPEGLMEVPQTGEWVTFKGTIPSSEINIVPSIRMGFPNGTQAGAAVEFNALHDGVLQPYYALEVPHDITLGAVNGDVAIKGLETKFQAKLLNQVDSVGYLAQDFTYTVFDANGNAVDGLAVENNEGVAVITAEDGVEEGTYYLRATTDIDAETTWQRTIAFTVASAIDNTDDYVVGAKPDNLVNAYSYNGSGNSSLSYTGQNLPGDVTNGENVTAFKNGTDTEMIFDHNKKQSEGNYWGVNGILIKFIDTTAHPKTNTTYVVYGQMRSSTGGHAINVTHTHSYNKKYTTYAHGLEGYEFQNTEWQDFKAVITTEPNGGVAEKKGNMLLGAVRAPANSYLLIRQIPGLYIAEEVAYDIKVDGDSDTVAAGEILNLNATVENQIGVEGKLEQSFNWVAVTEDRMNYVDGITFTPSDDGASVTVNVADTVAAGDYLIVAQSTAYDMNRQYPITVTAGLDYDVKDFNLVVEDGVATLDTLQVAAEDKVVVIIAAFNGNTLVTAKKGELTPEDGVAVLTDPLRIDELVAGNKVRVFVWDDNYTPFSMKGLWKLPVVVE